VIACKMLAYTWVRNNELRMMEWSEIDGDTWIILFSSVGYISLRRKPSIHAASGVFSQTAPQFHLGEA